MSENEAIKLAAKALHQELSLPVARANVWAELEDGARVLVIEIDPNLLAAMNARVPSHYHGFPVHVRGRMKPIAHLKVTNNA